MPKSNPPSRAESMAKNQQKAHRLIQNFCHKTDADSANMLSVLLTGLLANHFADAPKPVFLVDGNQPTLGKTLFADCVSAIAAGGNGGEDA